MYVKKQIGGAGSAYVILPKTTMTAAVGETAIAGQSGIVAVKSGDVLTVYVDGLAGDTTAPDYYTRWFEIDSLVTLADDAITAAAIKADAVTEIQSGLALEATLTAIKGAGWTDETLATLKTAIDAVPDTGDIMDTVVEGTYTLQDVLKIMSAVMAGKLSGGCTGTLTFRDLSDTLNRLVATVDLSTGDRDAITLDVT